MKLEDIDSPEDAQVIVDKTVDGIIKVLEPTTITDEQITQISRLIKLATMDTALMVGKGMILTMSEDLIEAAEHFKEERDRV